MVGTCVAGSRSRLALGEHGDLHVLAGSRRQRHRSTDHLLGLTWVNPEAHNQVDALVELRAVNGPDHFERIGTRVEITLRYPGRCIVVALAPATCVFILRHGVPLGSLVSAPVSGGARYSPVPEPPMLGGGHSVSIQVRRPLCPCCELCPPPATWRPRGRWRSGRASLPLRSPRPGPRRLNQPPRGPGSRRPCPTSPPA